MSHTTGIRLIGTNGDVEDERLWEIIHLYLEGKGISLIHLELLNSYVMLSKLKSRHEETSSSHYSGNSNHLYKQSYYIIKTFNMNNIQR